MLSSCYGDPRLPEYLERMLVEGPGDYDWPPAPRHYALEEFPLWERVWGQIWHQGDIYPATYIAVPVLCEVVARFPAVNHATLFSQLVMIEHSRPRFEPLIKPHLTESDLHNYQAALESLLPHLPAQLRMHDDATPHGLEDVQTILALMAFAAGQQWAGTLLGRHYPLLDLDTGEPSPALEDAANMLGRTDLPHNLKAQRQQWWNSFNAHKNEPFEDLEF
ncbi:hypothetical protein ACFP81_04840 [Deinococcus lacus]|uniref:YecA family protein n=1 Tax=Deinococcus lacus TaxID=392561 RepID=A0ABW1YB73_9DEIO